MLWSGYDGCAKNVTLQNKVPKDHVCNVQPLALGTSEAKGRLCTAAVGVQHAQTAGGCAVLPTTAAIECTV